MNENNKLSGSAVSKPATVWWKKPWLGGSIVVVLALAGYAWWAKPAFLFGAGSASSDAQAPGGGAPGGAGGFGGGGPGGFGGGAGGRRGAQTAPVGAAKARTTDVNIYLTALGSVTAANTSTVRVRVDGLVLNKLNFTEGQMVKQGQLLAEIDPRSLQVQLQLAQATLARDVAQLQNARVDLERYRNLVAQDSIPKQQLDTQEALVRQLDATLKMDQANVDAAKLQLSYAKVTAPTDGRIGLRQVDVGNIVRSSDTTGIAIITQVQPINAVFTIPEVNISRVLRQLNDKVKMPVEAWDREQKNKIAEGELVTADNQIDPTTGTIKLKAIFPNDDFALFPNQFINIRLLTDVRHGATVVPTAAIQRGTDNQFVYVVKDDKSVTVRQVRIGAQQGDDTMIISGVEPGEVVVIDGTDRLREGMKVEAIVRAEQAVPIGVKQGQRRNRNGGNGGQGGGQGFGGQRTNPDGTPRQRPDGQGGNADGGAGSGGNAGAATPAGTPADAGAGTGTGGGFSGQRPTNPDGTPREFPRTNPDGTPRQRPTNPDGTPRQFPNGGQGFGGQRSDGAAPSKSAQ